MASRKLAKHDAVTANLLRMFRQPDARGGRARTSARDDRNAAAGVPRRDLRYPFHFVVGKGAVATGAAHDADAVNPHLDLIVDNLSKRSRLSTRHRWQLA
jgi:hypothetical protein